MLLILLSWGSAALAAADFVEGAMVRLPGGSFTMGRNDASSYTDEETLHPVTLDSFFIGAFEVTRGEFLRFIDETGYVSSAERSGGAWAPVQGVWQFVPGLHWRNPGYAQTPEHPVTAVTWYDAVAYCNWLSRREGRVPAYEVKESHVVLCLNSDGYRLPTEAEWEYAARAGGAEPFSGGAEAARSGWVGLNSGGATHPVGTKPPNAWGLYDMTGNVWEWCWDWYGYHAYEEIGAAPPAGPAAGTCRVLRGGSWFSRERQARTTQRYSRLPGEAWVHAGFRIVRRAEEAE